MKEVIATYGQTIYDIAIQEYGCFEGIVIMLEDNPTLSADTEISAGDVIKIRIETPDLNGSNLTVLKALKQDNIQPNSKYERNESEKDFDPEDFDPQDFL